MLSSSNNPNILINETGTAQDSSNLVGLPTYEKTVSFSGSGLEPPQADKNIIKKVK